MSEPVLIDSKELIKKFYKFFEEYKKKDIKKIINEGQTFLPVSFFDISEYDFELGDQILSNPIECIAIMEETLKQFTELEEDLKPIKIRFTSLPATERIMIREIRSEHLNKLVLLEGLVRRKTDVRPRLKYLEYLCTNPSCNFSEDKIKVPQFEDKARVLKACPKCRSAVEVLNKVLLDSQSLVLEEIPEQLDNSGDQPKRIKILLQEDLVSPFKDSKTNPGARVYVIGIVKEIPIQTKSGSESINYDLIVEGNYIDMTEEDYSEIIISKEEEEEIKELAKKDDVVATLVKNTAPAIYGYNKIKEAILLQLFGGSGGQKGAGIKTRGDIHMLLLGDPGAAKSQLLKAATTVAPKSMFVSGKSATGAGLCVSPESLLLTNPGGMKTIENVVETRFDGKEELYREGIWKKDNIDDVKIQSMNDDLKMHAKNPQSIWKLKSPKKINQIILKSGKTVELTGNTALFSLENGETKWIKSNDLKTGMFIATPKKLIGGNSKGNIWSLIDSNPHVHDFEEELIKIIKLLKEKYNCSTKEIAKKFNINENNLYSIWIKKDLNGLPKLKDILKLSNDINYSINFNKLHLSLYNGKNFTLPKEFNHDITYLAGLIAGDGDIRMSGSTYSIRLSNNESNLINQFKNIVKDNFSLKCNLNKGNNQRPDAIRTNSKAFAEILFKLGIPESPKSDKINLSDELLHLDNNLLASYIAGLYDSDGCVYIRPENNRGSNLIEFTTCSKSLCKKLQLALLRFEIYSSIRTKEPSQTQIKGKLKKYVLSITNLEDIKKFAKNIKLRHPKKLKNLNKLSSLEVKSNTNYNKLPGVGLKLKETLQRNKINLKSVGWHENLSQQGLKNILDKIPNKNDDFKEFEILAQSDMLFEEIKQINKIDANYEYVYDLTVKDSHNFVVDGILVHNTATVVKDEMTGGWALEAGAIVLAAGGLCAIDEMDKMTDEDTSAMHEALEQQSISIAKANIRATLKCPTTVLGAANPKYGRFDPYGDIMKQIDFPPALVSRFDMIFIIRDIPDKKKDSLIAGHILEVHRDKSKTITEITPDFLKKYIAYAKTNIVPVLTKDAIEKIKAFYIAIRNAAGEDEEEQGLKAVPITARQLEAIVRLAEAYAKIKLDKKVRVEYAQKAIDMLMYCLEKIGLDPKTGQLDIDKITTGVTQSQRNEYKMVQKIIDNLEINNPEITLEAIIEEGDKHGIKEKDIHSVLSKLKQEGIIFEPRKGMFKKLH